MKRLVAAVATTVAVVVLFNLLYNSPNSQDILNPYPAFTQSYPSGKLVIFWTSFFGTEDYGVGLGNEPFHNCPVDQCFTTTDRSLLNQSDALIFHPRDIKLNDLPQHRLAHQRWIFYNLEPPYIPFTSFDPHLLENLSGVFNWTMTYRKDSDVYNPYSGSLNGHFPTFSDPMTGKKEKKVAWFVSNCRSFSGRELYVEQLKKYINVDIYGACGPHKCRSRESCYQMLSRDYKFYLSFENSLCRDYVTEKFFNILNHRVVPIVYGSANYSTFITKDAYIDVNDFSSAKHLASYLNFLDANDTAYERYFEWRQNPSSYRQLPREQSSFCQLCAILHDDSLPSKTYENIHKWWYEEANCITSMSLNTSVMTRVFIMLLIIFIAFGLVYVRFRRVNRSSDKCLIY